MAKTYDLTQGDISGGIRRVALPLITASFVQMAYSMTDMIWLGRLGSESVAAVGVAGFFAWICNALSFTSKVGAEVTISQSLGSRSPVRARIYANQAAQLSSVMALCYALFVYAAAPWLVGIFHLDQNVADLSAQYMRLICPGLFFTFNNNTYSGLYNGQGDSRTPLKIIATGLVCNIALDPLLIYGWGFIPAMGTAGAAVATSFSQLVVFSIFFWNLYVRQSSIGKLRFFTRPQGRFVRRIAFLGLPVSLQNGIFATFSITLATIAAKWGHIGVAVQSVGGQIEAITWMTAAGFSTALAAFTGQNYGAGKYKRAVKVYIASIVVTFLACFFALSILYASSSYLIPVFATSRSGFNQEFMEIIQRIFVYDSVSCLGIAIGGAGMDFLLGLGKTRITLLMNFLKIFVFRIPVLLILQLLIADGATALGVMMMITNCGTAIPITIISIYTARKLCRAEERKMTDY